MRTPDATFVAASRSILAQREAMVARWSEWLRDRMTSTPSVQQAVVEQQLGLILDVLAAMVGPLRREVKTIWARVNDHYGRLAAARGLAAGEVVEEMLYLRELLIRHLAPSIAALRPRQGMTLMLRLNRIVDHGVAQAVIGYTDAIVRTLLPGNGDELAPDAEPFDNAATARELAAIRQALADVTGRPGA